jgi:hypothetical protein
MDQKKGEQYNPGVGHETFDLSFFITSRLWYLRIGSLRKNLSKIQSRMNLYASLLHPLHACQFEQQVHAYDQCRAKIDLKNCVHHACTEVLSFNLLC